MIGLLQTYACVKSVRTAFVLEDSRQPQWCKQSNENWKCSQNRRSPQLSWRPTLRSIVPSREYDSKANEIYHRFDSDEQSKTESEKESTSLYSPLREDEYLARTRTLIEENRSDQRGCVRAHHCCVKDTFKRIQHSCFSIIWNSPLEPWLLQTEKVLSYCDSVLCNDLSFRSTPYWNPRRRLSVSKKNTPILFNKGIFEIGVTHRSQNPRRQLPVGTKMRKTVIYSPRRVLPEPRWHSQFGDRYPTSYWKTPLYHSIWVFTEPKRCVKVENRWSATF